MMSKRTTRHGYGVPIFGLAILLIPTLAHSGDVAYNYDNRHRLTEATYENGLTVTYDYDLVGNRTIKNSTVVNLSPYVPVYQSPANGAVDIDGYGAPLSWQGGDPNSNDVVGYDIYLGTTSPPALFQSDITESDILVDSLTDNTVYYWKIVAKDQGGLTAEGPIWSFTAAIADSDNDGISDRDETNTYGTDPNLADTDGDGITDGEELTFWGDNWSNDSDNDGLHNLLDPDSDNDGHNDGVERAQGTNPEDPASNPPEKMRKVFMILDD